MIDWDVSPVAMFFYSYSEFFPVVLTPAVYDTKPLDAFCDGRAGVVVVVVVVIVGIGDFRSWI